MPMTAKQQQQITDDIVDVALKLREQAEKVKQKLDELQAEE